MSNTPVAPRPVALLVDRDEDTRSMYAQYLKLLAWDVEQAADGREALAIAIRLHPDVVITETRLSGISGYELCALLHDDPSTRDTPVVFVTGDAFDTEVTKAKDAGAACVLTKPCLPESLGAELRRVTTPAIRHRDTTVPRRLPSPSTDKPQRATLKRLHHRGDTTDPPTAPPELLCPNCDRPLLYQRSHVGGVSAKHTEQWDYFECSGGCGTFQYRIRTRKLRRVM